jgi:hypothetical protein
MQLLIYYCCKQRNCSGLNIHTWCKDTTAAVVAAAAAHMVLMAVAHPMHCGCVHCLLLLMPYKAPATPHLEDHRTQLCDIIKALLWCLQATPAALVT